MRGSFHGVFAPRSISSLLRLFSSGQDGLLLLPQPHPDYPQYIEDTGQTEAGADQAVGFVTDRSQGGFGNLGANQFQNPNGPLGSSPWVLTNMLASGSELTRNGAQARIHQNLGSLLTAENKHTFWRLSAAARHVSGITGVQFNVTPVGMSGVLNSYTLSDTTTTHRVVHHLTANQVDTASDLQVHPLHYPGTGTGDTAELTFASFLRIPGHHAIQATSANRPLLKNENGLWFWQPDRGNDNHVIPGLALTQPFTVCAAVRLTDTTNQTVFTGTNASPAILRVNASKQIEINAGAAVAGPTLTLPDTVVISAIFDGANSRVRVNAGPWSSGNAGSNGVSGARIYADSAGTGEFMGDRCYGIAAPPGDLDAEGTLGRTERKLAKLAGITL